MISGIFFVDFSSNLRSVGSGLAVINDGEVNGGDANYLYQGQIDAYGGQAKVTIHVTHYRGPLNSVFGPLRSFTLDLAGRVEEGGFDLNGGIQGVPNSAIRIVGRRVAQLFQRGA